MNKPSTRLLKHIIKCYFRLCENNRALMALMQNVPVLVKEKQIVGSKIMETLDESSKRLLRSLTENLCPVNQDEREQDVQSRINNMPALQ